MALVPADRRLPSVIFHLVLCIVSRRCLCIGCLLTRVLCPVDPLFLFMCLEHSLPQYSDVLSPGPRVHAWCGPIGIRRARLRRGPGTGGR
jgi:hypothetical protein